MSWCDKLASTPAMGFRLDPSLIPSEVILSSIAPFLNENIEDDRPTFDVEVIEAFKVVLNTESGYRYAFDHNSISITYNHRIRYQAGSAGPPVMELISKPAPYTDLLSHVSGRLARVISMLPNIKDRQIRRVGVISATTVDLDDAPPGIGQLFGEIGRPLGRKVDNFSCSITTKLSQNPSFVDRCIHTLMLPEPPKKLINIQLDWQRTFESPRSSSKSVIADILKDAENRALEYFELVAEGDLADGTGNGD